MNELVRVPEQEPDSYLDETDLIAEINDRRKAAREKRDKWIDGDTGAKNCYAFVAGDQWSTDDKQTLKDTNRVPVTFNRVQPTIDVVAGMEVSNRHEVNYLPRELGDANVSEVDTAAAKWVRDECNAEDEESESFLDMAICGEGWTNTSLDYEYEPDGNILIARIDPLELLPDPASEKKNYKDAEYLIRERMVDTEWVKDKWPDKADAIHAQSTDDQSSGDLSGDVHRMTIGDQYDAPNDDMRGGTRAPKQIKLTEYQCKKREPFYRVADPQSGQLAELSVEQFERVNAQAQKYGIKLQAVRQTRCNYMRSFCVGSVLLETGSCPDPTSFTYKAMTAKRDRNARQWYGLVRGMIDPQRWANKWLSQGMHIMNSNAKGGLVVEEGAVEDWTKFEASWAKTDQITRVKQGTLTQGRIQPKVPPPFPTQLGELMGFAVQSIRDVSGVSVELLGMADRDQPASLEYQRKQAGITILATLFDALRKYRKEQGRSLLYLINTYISDGRLIRVVGEEGAKYVPLMKHPDSIKYDIIVDESPTSPNQKEKVWAVLQGLLPMLIKAGIELPPETFKYLPLPRALTEAMTKPDPQKQQEQQMQKELALKEKTSEIQKTEAEAKKFEAEAFVKITDANLKKAEIEGQGAEMQNKMQVDAINAQEQAALKRWQAERDAELAVWKAEQDAILKAQIAEFDAGLQKKTAEGDMSLKRETAEGEQALKGIPEVKKASELVAGVQEKIDFLQDQLKRVEELAGADEEIIRDEDGRVKGKRKVLPERADS